MSRCKAPSKASVRNWARRGRLEEPQRWCWRNVKRDRFSQDSVVSSCVPVSSDHGLSVCGGRRGNVRSLRLARSARLRWNFHCEGSSVAHGVAHGDRGCGHVQGVLRVRAGVFNELRGQSNRCGHSSAIVQPLSSSLVDVSSQTFQWSFSLASHQRRQRNGQCRSQRD